MSLGDIRDCAPCKPYLSTSSTFVYPLNVVCVILSIGLRKYLFRI
jgi:hypothetical protein